MYIIIIHTINSHTTYQTSYITYEVEAWGLEGPHEDHNLEIATVFAEQFTLAVSHTNDPDCQAEAP